jgi:hypothetical protein
VHSYAAERLVTADASVVSAAIGDLVETVWGRAARLLDDSGLRRIDALAAAPTDEAADVWLSWELTPVSGATHVRLVLDELEAGPEPIEELATVLDMLAERVAISF